MTATAQAGRMRAALVARARVQSDLLFDWVMVLLSAWFLGGLYLDGWAHHHLAELESFFTPWHAVFYSGFVAVAAFLVGAAVAGRRRGVPWTQAVPAGYWLSLLGVPFFLLGGVADMFWHLLFGIEMDVEALLSPTHLLLAVSIAFIVSGPLQAAWRRPAGDGLAWRNGLPALLSLTFILALLTFFTQFAHPQVRTWAAADVPVLPVHNDIYLMRADGSGQTRLTGDPTVEYRHPRWSPDGSKLAFAAFRDDGAQIYVMTTDGSQTQLTHTGEWNVLPAWSPDGRQLAFVSRRGANTEIYVMDGDGRNERRLTTTTADNYNPAWSPDGGRIAFASERDGDLDIYVMNADGRDQTRLTSGRPRNWLPSWSPDGDKLTFVSTRDGRPQVYVMHADGTGQTRLTDGTSDDWAPVWSPDGRSIAFVSWRDKNGEIYVMNADGSGRTNLSRNPGLQEGDHLLAWSPDGSRLAYTARGHSPVDADHSRAHGLASILLQAGLLMGVVLLAVRRWVLPLGSLTLIFGLSSLLISVMEDTQALVPAALLAGVIADALRWRLRPGADRPGALRLFAVAVPVVYFGLYFLALLATSGIGWSVHLAAGAPVMAGIVGLLLSYLLAPSRDQGAARPASG